MLDAGERRLFVSNATSGANAMLRSIALRDQAMRCFMSATSTTPYATPSRHVAKQGGVKAG